MRLSLNRLESRQRTFASSAGAGEPCRQLGSPSGPLASKFRRATRSPSTARVRDGAALDTDDGAIASELDELRQRVLLELDAKHRVPAALSAKRAGAR